MAHQNDEGTEFDEFDESTIQPISQFSESGKPWKGVGPAFQGDATPCFEGGYLYRLVNREGNKWAFYNDTAVFEMHVTFTFGKDSVLEALGNTNIVIDESGEFVATAVVYPMETAMFISGAWNGYRSSFKSQPLSRDYLHSISQSSAQSVERDQHEAEKLCPSLEEEDMLRTCISHGTLFIDPKFPPTYRSVDGGKGVLPPVPWARPKDYLAANLVDHVRLFRSPITPFSVEHGDLSDSWLISAMAVLAERPGCLKNLFRHPVDPTETAKEAMVGAHRVLINKDGMWRSYIVDTYLPVVAGTPRFARSRDNPCEMWVSILEKAYAKRTGSYMSICSGDPLVALRDLTGYPTTRLDADFMEAHKNSKKSDEFFTRLLALCRAGHTIIFSTPGNEDNSADMTKYKDAGIAIGYTQLVLDIKHVNGYGLFHLCNPWSHECKWKGNWSPSSPLWTENPDVAAECPDHDGSNGSLWMNWADVKSFFVGCGVLFNTPSSCDYRVPGTFTHAAPSVCLEIDVSAPITMSFILSQSERRGTVQDAVNYDAIMLNMASSEGEDNQFTVIANTSTDAETPTDQYVFLKGRDVSMIYELVPEHSPYLVIPRRMVSEEKIDEDMPFTIGVITSQPITKAGPVKILFKRLPANNEVFDNYPQFNNDAEGISVEYQIKHSNSRLEMRGANQLYE